MSEPRDSNIGIRIVRIACGTCGTEMNPHGEKAVAPLTSAEAAGADWAVGGLMEEIHQCPRCGRVESRRAP